MFCPYPQCGEWAVELQRKQMMSLRSDWPTRKKIKTQEAAEVPQHKDRTKPGTEPRTEPGLDRGLELDRE